MTYEQLKKLYEIAFKDGINSKIIAGNLASVCDEGVARAIYLAFKEEKQND